MAARSPIPVVAVSGGLGSGKTSLLNHVLGQGVGRVGVVINDFGAINVDAFLVHGQVDATATISGGCLCCLSDPSELDDILSALASPSLDLDVILIEASGLAEPRELARMIVTSDVRGIRFGGIVEILDAAAWADVPGDADARDLPVAIDHLQVASLIVVNKVDRLPSPAGTPVLESALARHAGDTPVVRTSHGRIDPTLLFDASDRPDPIGQLSFVDLLTEQARDGAHDDDAHAHAGHAHHRYASVSVDSPLPTDPGALIRFLDARASGVYRVKGRTWVDAPGHGDLLLVQAVGGWLSFERRPWPAGTERRTELVAIGTGMDESKITSTMRACLAASAPPDDVDLRLLTRYTRR